MWAFRRTLILSTLMQAATFAWAENTLPQNTSAPEGPNLTARSLPRLHFLNEHFLNPVERTYPVDPGFHSQTIGGNGRFAPLDNAQDNAQYSGHPPGLNFTLTGPHPGLEYKFSDNARVHLRANARGASVTAVWGF